MDSLQILVALGVNRKYIQPVNIIYCTFYCLFIHIQDTITKYDILGKKENITCNPKKKVINKSRSTKCIDIGITTQELNNNYYKYVEGISVKGEQNV